MPLSILALVFLRDAYAQDEELATSDVCWEAPPVIGKDPVAEWFTDGDGRPSLLVYAVDRRDLTYRVDYRLTFGVTDVPWSGEPWTPEAGESLEIDLALPEEVSVSADQATWYSQVLAVLVVLDGDSHEVFQTGAGSVWLRLDGGDITDALTWETLEAGGGFGLDGQFLDGGTGLTTADGESVIITGVAPPD